MAAWRRAIELSLGDADVEKLRSIAQSRTEPASRVVRGLCWAIGRTRLFSQWAKRLDCIIRRSGAVLSGPWRKGRWRRWTIALDLAGSQGSSSCRRSLERPAL